jgi:hypothetical protein
MECIDLANDEKIQEIQTYTDDTWVRPEDKKNLLLCIKNIYKSRYEWADDQLLKCMILHHYKSCIKNMDKNAYLQEISKTDVDTLLDTIV